MALGTWLYAVCGRAVGIFRRVDRPVSACREGRDGTVLPDGESLVFSDFASITDAGRVDATFEYAAGAGTSLDNYEVTVKKGTLTVNASAAVTASSPTVSGSVRNSEPPK